MCGGLAGRDLADGAAALAVPRLGHEHFADLALEDPLDAVANTRRAAALRADLQQFSRPPTSSGHQPPFADVVATRLFHVDMFAGVECQDGRGGVPMVGRGDHHGIDVVVVQHAAQVGHGRGSFARGGLDPRAAAASRFRSTSQT